MRRRIRLVLVVLVLIAVVAGLLFVAFRETAVPVETQPVVRGPMLVTVDVDGKTRIREVYRVAAPTSGTALRSPVRVGDEVVGGVTVVARVQPAAPALLDARTRVQAEAAVREAEAAVRAAESRLREAEEELTLAQTQYDRVRTLVERGAASMIRLEDAEATRSVRELARDSAASSLEMAHGALDRTQAALIEPNGTGTGVGTCCIELVAPVSGRVLAIEEVSERPVAAGMHLVSIGEPTDLEIVADLLSRDAVSIPEGAEAIVERWGRPEPLKARLRRIEPSARTLVSTLGVEEQRVEALFDLVTPPNERPGLGDGYAVLVRVVIWRGEDVPQVPLGALFRHGATWAVFRVVDGRAVVAPVVIGHRNERAAEIVSGLDAGDSVITHPGDSVSDGVMVVPTTRM